ncbi:hypothetical protein C4J92_3585 [Pseudomonas sp. R3-18-08]|nr:hypothetical protein C4J92_3585 [Pseudomonas sp. R3-18-08]
MLTDPPPSGASPLPQFDLIHSSQWPHFGNPQLALPGA